MAFIDKIQMCLKKILSCCLSLLAEVIEGVEMAGPSDLCLLPLLLSLRNSNLPPLTSNF
jgi:hypothetical protein